jgi:hypothetical protein
MGVNIDLPPNLHCGTVSTCLLLIWMMTRSTKHSAHGFAFLLNNSKSWCPASKGKTLSVGGTKEMRTAPRRKQHPYRFLYCVPFATLTGGGHSTTFQRTQLWALTWLEHFTITLHAMGVPFCTTGTLTVVQQMTGTGTLTSNLTQMQFCIHYPWKNMTCRSCRSDYQLTKLSCSSPVKALELSGT